MYNIGQGFIYGGDDRENDRRLYDRLENKYSKILISNAQLVVCTTYMASCKWLLNEQSDGYIKRKLVGVDESPSCSDHQFFGAIVFQEDAEVVISAGDPKQSFPFVISQKAKSLQQCTHRCLVARNSGFTKIIQFRKQYRMQNNLMLFSNHNVYDG